MHYHMVQRSNDSHTSLVSEKQVELLIFISQSLSWSLDWLLQSPLIAWFVTASTCNMLHDSLASQTQPTKVICAGVGWVLLARVMQVTCPWESALYHTVCNVGHWGVQGDRKVKLGRQESGCDWETEECSCHGSARTDTYTTPWSPRIRLGERGVSYQYRYPAVQLHYVCFRRHLCWV